MSNIYEAITKACDHVGTTKREGDKEKWAVYLSLKDYESKKMMRILWGHGEFCRLQRLSFHRFI